MNEAASDVKHGLFLFLGSALGVGLLFLLSSIGKPKQSATAGCGCGK